MGFAEFARVFRTLALTAAALVSPGSGPGKVFAIGFNKTGTTSLHDIFAGLGYHSYHGRAWRDTSRRLIFHHYDAFSDGPPDDFRRLDRTYPGSKFILQVRDLDDWIDSRLEHIRRLPHLRGRGPGWEATEAAICSWVRRRNLHHAGVMLYFRARPEDLLVINYIRDPQSAVRICAFLGRPALVQKPHSNPNPRAGKALKNAAMIARALASLNIPESEWKNDLLCPAILPSGPEAWLPADTKDLGRAAR